MCSDTAYTMTSPFLTKIVSISTWKISTWNKALFRRYFFLKWLVCLSIISRVLPSTYLQAIEHFITLIHAANFTLITTETIAKDASAFACMQVTGYYGRLNVQLIEKTRLFDEKLSLSMKKPDFSIKNLGYSLRNRVYHRKAGFLDWKTRFFDKKLGFLVEKPSSLKFGR